MAFDGTNIWVANNTSSTLSRINPASASVTETVDLPPGSGPIGLAFDGVNLWVSNNTTDTVSRIDVGRGTVTERL